jgi:hypothetical protein
MGISLLKFNRGLGLLYIFNINIYKQWRIIMLGNSSAIDLLLLEKVLGRQVDSNPFEMIEKVRKWDADETKRAKEKADKKPGSSPKIFSFADVVCLLLGFGLPAGLAWLWGVIELYDIVNHRAAGVFH